MFDDKFFDDWLESQAYKEMEQVASGQSTVFVMCMTFEL